MKALRTRLQEARRQTGMPWEAIERDYLLSWILAGIGRVAPLRESLVFKGGTALKKCYFGEYRFSEDLDFSGLDGCPTGEALATAIGAACEAATELLDEYAPVDIACRRYTERDPHPGGQEAFTVRARLPWQKEPTTRVMIEITMDEPVLRPITRRAILHGYGEPMQADVQVYALEEIVAEKLRAILQHARLLRERGWSRSRARDYYDLWRLFGTYREQMDLAGFGALLRAKCAIRDVSFDGPTDFFQAPSLEHVRGTWEQWLGPLVADLPPFESVIGDLRPRIEAMLP